MRSEQNPGHIEHTGARGLEVRKPDFGPERDLPHYWINDSAFDTYFGNALHYMFPDGERFFIRSVQRYAAEVRDPGLKLRVKGFLAQEVQHGSQHEACWKILESQGYPTERYLRFFRKLSFEIVEPQIIKRFGPRMSLAVTVAMEHFTAVLAETMLSSGWLDRTSPGMRKLMTWHACEEIEHKEVAFDVLQASGGGYWLRFGGMLLALMAMAGVLSSGMLFSLWHDRQMSFARALRLPGEALRFFWRLRRLPWQTLQYFAPGFHPDQNDNRALIATEMPAI